MSAALALAKRGWRVKVFSRRYGEARGEGEGGTGVGVEDAGGTGMGFEDAGGTPAPLEEMDFEEQDGGGTPPLLEFPDLERLPVSKEAFHALLAENAAAFAEVDHLFLMKAGMRVIAPVGKEMLGELVAVGTRATGTRPVRGSLTSARKSVVK